MKDSEPFEELRRTKESLRVGLGLLEGGAASSGEAADTGLRAAWEKVISALTGADALADLRGQVDAPELAAFDDELREVIRLNAVLMASVKAEQERVTGRLRRVRESRRELAYYAGTRAEGERCDISG
ncbi:MAG: hypothetical protein AAGG01_00510 [Planctomycetota bacterium]